MALKLMIDTNIFLDVFEERSGFFENSQKVLELCANKKAKGFVTASAITDIYFLLHKQLHDKEAAYNALGNIFSIVDIIPTTAKQVKMAYSQKAKDFEDCLLAICAKSAKCDAIITRNPKDFKDVGVDISILTPKEFLENIK